MGAKSHGVAAAIVVAAPPGGLSSRSGILIGLLSKRKAGSARIARKISSLCGGVKAIKCDYRQCLRLVNHGMVAAWVV